MANGKDKRDGGKKKKTKISKYRKVKSHVFNHAKDLEYRTGTSDQPDIVYSMQSKSGSTARPSQKEVDMLKEKTGMRNAAIDKLIYRYEP
tara:strand:+ start:365 stop:634 length:270 start_codon:yes stop_codon:yes gene_type:complete